VLEVPRPFADWKAVECGAALMGRLKARALLIAGAHPLASRDGSADVLAAPGSPFQAAHALLRRHDIVQIRGEPDAETLARGGGTDPVLEPGEGAAARSGEAPAHRPTMRLYYERELPEDLRLRDLAAIGGGEEPALVLPGGGRHERLNIQRDTAARAFAVLALSAEGARRTIALALTGQRVASEVDIRNIDGYLLAWLDEEKQALAASGSELYKAPDAAELVYMDEEVLTPLVRLQARAARSGAEPGEDALVEIARAAGQVGYELIRYTYSYTGARFLILRERDGPLRRFRGTFVFRLGPCSRYAIEVPYPITDYHTFEAGARLFEFLEAGALVFAGASRFANVDGSADVANPRHIESYFQLAHQVLLRETDGGLLAVSVRGFSSEASAPGQDIVLSTGREVKRREDLPPLVHALEDDLRRLGADVGIFDGSREMLRYQGGRTGQWAYSDVQYPGSFVYCWLSSEFREAFRDRLPPEAGAAADEALPDIGLGELRGNLLSYVEATLAERRRRAAARGPEPPPEPARAEEARAAIEALRRYDASENVVYLVRAKEHADRAGATLSHFLDVSSSRRYLVLTPPPGMEQVLFISNLHPSLREEQQVERGRPDLFAALAAFVSKGYEALLVTEGGGGR
jgi:hypothetical protein